MVLEVMLEVVDVVAVVDDVELDEALSVVVVTAWGGPEPPV